MTYEEKKKQFVKALREKNLTVDEGKPEDGIEFALSHLDCDLHCVWASITREEIQYHVENDEDEE